MSPATTYSSQISTNGTSWTTLRDHNANVASYTQYTANLDPYLGDSTVYVRFQGSMGDTSDNFYVDSIALTNDSTSATSTGTTARTPCRAAKRRAPANASSTSRP